MKMGFSKNCNGIFVWDWDFNEKGKLGMG